MSNDTFNGSAQITDEGIKKHFKSFEPVQAINELVWNGLDANANTVKVRITHNDMEGLESISIFDDGDGIDIKDLKNNFKKFNESSKKHDDDKHGSHGKGRLAFHKLSDKAVWYTRRDEYDAKITIDSSAIKKFNGAYLDKPEQHASLDSLKSGTCVELSSFRNKNLPKDNELLKILGKEFGWFLALNSTRKVMLNGDQITAPAHEIYETEFTIEEHKFVAKVIRWDDRPSSEKSYNYLVNSHSRTVQKELSKFNNKVNFHTSAFVFSEWIDDYNPVALEMELNDSGALKIYKKIMAKLLSFQKDIYSEYLRSYVDYEIERYDKNGYFPNYENIDKSYAEWRKSNTKLVVREIYIADPTIFNKLKPKQAKILIRLLDKILVSNENDTLFEILDGVLDLSSEHMDLFSNQLKKTTLENVISSIEILQRRQHAIHELREVMENRYSEILETPDLQKIIENNTWLFGPQHTTLGAEEDTFNKIAINLRNEIKDINLVSELDIDDGSCVEGVNRQVDLFLARKVPTFDSEGRQIFKCVIIEIKRPGISLNKKHLQQLDDYAEIISKHAVLSSEKMIYELILIGRKISRDDYAINQWLDNLKDKAELGLVSNGRIKCYVKDWFTIFDEFDLSNNYLLKTLNTKLDDLSVSSTNEIVTDLQTTKID